MSSMRFEICFNWFALQKEKNGDTKYEKGSINYRF